MNRLIYILVFPIIILTVWISFCKITRDFWFFHLNQTIVIIIIYLLISFLYIFITKHIYEVYLKNLLHNYYPKEYKTLLQIQKRNLTLNRTLDNIKFVISKTDDRSNGLKLIKAGFLASDCMMFILFFLSIFYLSTIFK